MHGIRDTKQSRPVANRVARRSQYQQANLEAAPKTASAPRLDAVPRLSSPAHSLHSLVFLIVGESVFPVSVTE